MAPLAWIWLGVALVFLIIEILPGPFGFSLVSISALVAAAVDALGQPAWVQVVFFAVCCVVSLTLLRSRIIGKIAEAPGVPSRVERLIGHRGRVVEAIDPAGSHGRVMVEGTDWAADSENKKAIAVGAEVEVVGSRGIRLIVKVVGG